jgi:thiamine biosynthesis lipoprotein
MSQTFEVLYPCMGTVFRFAGNSEQSPAQTQSILDRACALLDEADRTFSLYKPESPLSKLARGETSVALCPPVVDQVWNLCEDWEKTTQGWFSAFTPQNTFDPSGLVKTWAAQKAADHLLESGIDDFTLNAGGDVFIAPGASSPIDWRIGISKPVSIASAEAGVLTVLDLRGKGFTSMATSGTAERGEHIWNPKAPDKAAANELVQVSVVAQDLVTADVWATAAFAMGARCIDILNAHNLANPQAQVQALAVWPNGDLGATEGFIGLFAKPETSHG